MRAICISAVLFLFCLDTLAQTVELRGKVINTQGKPVAFASIWLPDSLKGAVSNEAGLFRLKLTRGTYTICFRGPGYTDLPLTIKLDSNVVNKVIRLFVNGPIDPANVGADSIIRHVIARRYAYRLQLDAYTGYLYTKTLQRLEGAKKTFMKKDITDKLNLTADGLGIISLAESFSRFHTVSTDYIKEQAQAAKLTANSEAFGFNSAAELHIDFYQNVLLFTGLCDHAFLSPIAKKGRKYYRFKLTRQFTDGDKLIDEIRVQPKHRDEHLFTGNIYIVDKQWLLYGIDLSLSPKSHIDFIDSVRVKQQFIPLPDGSWQPQDMTFSFHGKLLGFKYGGYFLQVFQNAGVDTTTKRGSYDEVFHSAKDTYKKDDQFWAETRSTPLLPDEDKFYQAISLAVRHRRDKTLADSLQNTNNRFQVTPYIFNGYTLHNYRKNSSWSFPSPYNMFFYNTVEGFGVDLHAKYTKIYENERKLNIIPDVRYGSSDHTYNANVFVNFTYNPYHQASVYGRVGSNFLDLNNTGTISPFLNSLNTLLLGNNYIKLYQSKFIMGGTDGEIANGVLLNGQLEYAERKSLLNTTQHTFNSDSVKLTSNNPLDPNRDSPLFPPYRALTFRASVTFTFAQEYKIVPAGKFILPNPYPRVRINYREGLPVLGSNVNYNFVSIDVFQDHLNMGIYGYTSYFLSAGTFPNTHSLLYPDFNQFSGGRSFFFDATLGSFHFLNYYTYSTSKSYFQAHLEHNFTGLMMSKVPLLNKLNLQEIVGGSFLTQGTLPDYKEVYIGLKRTVIRLDYGLAFGRFTNRVQGFRLSYNW